MDNVAYKEKRIVAFLSGDLFPANADKLSEFDAEQNENGIGAHTRYTYANYLTAFDKFLGKPFEDATKKDVMDFLKSLDYGEGTKVIVKQRLKTFYKWMNGGESYPECVKWIKIKSKQPEKIDENNILTHEDILSLIQKAKNPRDKAFISLLYESAARVREFTKLKIKDYHKNGEPTAWLKIHGKGGIIREVMIINSIPYLSRWINDHPNNDDPEAYLFPNNKGGKLTRSAVISMLGKYGRMADLKKAINPHWFRHSRITEVAQIYNESELRDFAGWSRTSQMPSRYVHESKAIMAAKMMKRAGMETGEEILEDGLKPTHCPYCGHVNEQEANYCNKCASPLSEQVARSHKETKEETKKVESGIGDLDARALLYEMQQLREEMAKLKTKA